MAANDIATLATWQINSATQGNKRLKRMKDWDVADGGSKEAVPEVGSAAMVGFMRKPGPKTISFNFRQTKGAQPDVNWSFLQKSDEVFSLTVQVVGGQRVQFPECQVSSYSPKGDDQGENTYTVEIIALDDAGM